MIHLICPMCKFTDMIEKEKPLPDCYKCLTRMELDPDFSQEPVEFEGWPFTIDDWGDIVDEEEEL